MPRISYFCSIALYMYYRDHSPPHFHAIYGEYEAEFEIATSAVTADKLPRRAHALVSDWTVAHREELEENWELARLGEPLNAIDPME